MAPPVLSDFSIGTAGTELFEADRSTSGQSVFTPLEKGELLIDDMQAS
jgi:hypothetical protein